eukprot:NODE_2189_length_657_cov_144.006579_g1846_i0.p2 GENE.NODE_2189_length_657_cov_144.006579_g1846_i0~~NODE_2189_length_657_cov_144.006579_g1846_i0.p2  ORF type:complete len:123 (-),score=40.43 NODE_2189_length_657_cov_144.006579_g1846_i0:289-630(-)
MGTVKLGNFKFGVIHGHQVVPWGDRESLAIWQRKLDVDVLISGHTHAMRISKAEGKYYVNPGSITGAFSNLETEVRPSFILLHLSDDSITTYIYSISGDQLEVKKETYDRNSA